MTTNDIMISILPYFVVIFLLYYVFSIIGNVLIFNKAGLGKKKWLGLIPIVNDFMLYKTFWNLKAFIVYIIYTPAEQQINISPDFACLQALLY